MDALSNTETLDEYIKELTKFDAEDPDFVDTVQEIHRILAADPEYAGKAPNFTPIASGGTLRFSVPRVGGHGACEKTGTGAFYVNESKKHKQGGNFELTFTRTSVEVKLFSGGALVDTLKGRGGAERVIEQRRGAVERDLDPFIRDLRASRLNVLDWKEVVH